MPASKGKGLAAAASFNNTPKILILLYDTKKEIALLWFHQGQLEARMLMLAYWATIRSSCRNINPILCMLNIA